MTKDALYLLVLSHSCYWLQPVVDDEANERRIYSAENFPPSKDSAQKFRQRLWAKACSMAWKKVVTWLIHQRIVTELSAKYRTMVVLMPKSVGTGLRSKAEMSESKKIVSENRWLCKTIKHDFEGKKRQEVERPCCWSC